jgi:hypothetical protein
MASFLSFCWSSLATPLQAYIGKPLRDSNTERDGGETATKIIAELAQNGSDFELILTSTRKKRPS